MGESLSISHSTDVTNISPHRMYEMYMFGKYLLLSDIIWQAPLHFAAYFGYIECVEVFLQYGADKSLKNVWNHQDCWEGDWERFDMRQWVTDNVWVREWVQEKNDKENIWFEKIWGAFFLHVFLIWCESPS
jgi:hypothetical protein